MPELPDVTLYVEAIKQRTTGRTLRGLRVQSPFVLRTVEPSTADVVGKRVNDVERMGKRIVIALEAELYIVIHLMISGRLWWRKPEVAIPRGKGLAAFDFDDGSILFTEVSKKKRAALHLTHGAAALDQFDQGGLEILDSDCSAFVAALTRENHTLKRALTDPRVFSGIGNAYSDEILFAARISPFKQSQNLSVAEQSRLFEATRTTLSAWTDKLRTELNGKFPEKVTAFHKDMAVHGKYKQPCQVCGAPIQRIVYAEKESNYCAGCQTGGRLLADRALSRLLKQNWPKTLDELEGR